jgi:hypothetical protein
VNTVNTGHGKNAADLAAGVRWLMSIGAEGRGGERNSSASAGVATALEKVYPHRQTVS